ncbi:MAG: ABC transporter permease subunit [Pseudothermotoga sp.]
MKNFSSILFVSVVSIAAITVVAALFGIVFFVSSESLKAIKEVGTDLFSSNWYPVWSEPEFGISTMLLNTLLLTLWTSLWVWIIGVICAFYLHHFANENEKKIILRTLEYVSSIPSVVLGFFGVVVVGPMLLNLGAWTAQNFLNASIMLAVLTLPYMTSLSYQSFEKVPKEIIEGCISLGARDLHLMYVEMRHALPGIVNAMMLVFNRILGETMIVLMVAGGANILPRSFFDPIRPLTAALGSEIGEVEVGSLHYSSLFFIGFLLLMCSLLLNILTNCLVRKTERWVKG